MKRYVISLTLLFGISIFLGWLIRYFYQESLIDKNNKKIIRDLKIIKNNLLLTIQSSQKLPDPDYVIDIYSGIKKWLYCHLKEPFFWRCYVYAKTWNKFQIAGIIKTKNWRKTIITWNTKTPLIKDRKSNYLITNGSTKFFPYDPTWKLSYWYIIDCTWKIYINNDQITNCKNFKINNSDIIKVDWQVEILLSDWRKLNISSINWQPAIFTLKNRLYTNKNEDILLIIGKAIAKLWNFKIKNPWWDYLVIKWNILEVYIKKQSYIVEKKWKKEKVKISYKILKNNLDKLFTNTSLKADILSKKIDLENLIILDK